MEKQTLKQTIQEMEHSFKSWDERIKIKVQPVTIQDLDFWIQTLKEVSLRAEELVKRTEALDERLLEGTRTIELGEITRMKEVLN